MCRQKAMSCGGVWERCRGEGCGSDVVGGVWESCRGEGSGSDVVERGVGALLC